MVEDAAGDTDGVGVADAVGLAEPTGVGVTEAAGVDVGAPDVGSVSPSSSISPLVVGDGLAGVLAAGLVGALVEIDGAGVALGVALQPDRASRQASPRAAAFDN